MIRVICGDRILCYLGNELRKRSCNNDCNLWGIQCKCSKHNKNLPKTLKAWVKVVFDKYKTR